MYRAKSNVNASSMISTYDFQFLFYTQNFISALERKATQKQNHTHGHYTAKF